MGMGNGRQNTGRFSFLFASPHEQEPFPEPLEIAVAIRPVYHGLLSLIFLTKYGLMEEAKNEVGYKIENVF